MEQPIFIGGAGRSGTTLMRVMLNAHPALCSGPEFKMLNQITALYNTMINPGYLEIASAYEWKKEDMTDHYRKFILGFFEKFKASSGAHRLVEKTPHNVLIMKELGEIFPKAKFIHVIRDGRDVCSSLIKMNWIGGDGKKLWYTNDIKGASMYWTKVVSAGLAIGQHPLVKNRVKIIRYEDLIENTESVLKDLFVFLEEPWHESVLRYHEVKRRNEPLESSTSQVEKAVYKDSKRNWLSVFTEQDATDFLASGAGKLLMQLGYEKDENWVKEVSK
jgi:protein-tyrosine sulfotransferase